MKLINFCKEEFPTGSVVDWPSLPSTFEKLKIFFAINFSFYRAAPAPGCYAMSVVGWVAEPVFHLRNEPRANTRNPLQPGWPRAVWI